MSSNSGNQSIAALDALGLWDFPAWLPSMPPKRLHKSAQICTMWCNAMLWGKRLQQKLLPIQAGKTNVQTSPRSKCPPPFCNLKTQDGEKPDLWEHRNCAKWRVGLGPIVLRHSDVENLKHGIVSKSCHEQNPIGLSGCRQKPTVVSSSLRPTTRAPP